MNSRIAVNGVMSDPACVIQHIQHKRLYCSKKDTYPEFRTTLSFSKRLLNFLVEFQQSHQIKSDIALSFLCTFLVAAVNDGISITKLRVLVLCCLLLFLAQKHTRRNVEGRSKLVFFLYQEID